MEKFIALNSSDTITVNIFGKERKIEVFSTGDNRFDEEGDYKEDGFVYPEISYCGECKCDPEHGICIGFRDNEFLGIESMDWTL